MSAATASLPVDPAFRWTREGWGDALRCVPLEREAQHLFTTKQLQLRGADATPDRWALAVDSLDADAPGRAAAATVMRVTQVHGATVRVLRRGAVDAEAAREKPEADAVVSNSPGLVLAVQVADCVPLLMADARSGAAGAVHAGWRGTAAGVTRAAIEAMTREFGTRPEDLVVAMGPSIGPAHYEVGRELVDAFAAAGATSSDIERWFRRDGGRVMLDLWTANRDQALRCGVLSDRVFLCGLSSMAHPDRFESYRRDGAAAGRMAAMIRVPA